MKNILKIIGILLCISWVQISYGQDATIKAAWNEGKQLANNRDYAAAKPYLLTVYKEMPRPLCCYFLGLAYDLEGVTDSAVFYYQKCMDNSRKPQLRAWDNLVRLYLRQLQFDKAYDMAWDGVQKYVGNKTVLDEFKEVCKWSYAVKHLGLNKDYLQDCSLKKSYKVATIVEQYLIVKNIRDKHDQYLHIGNRKYKGWTENWACSFNGTKENETIIFELKDKDLDKQIALLHENARAVYNDKTEDLRVRLGALLSLTPLNDKMILDLLAADKEEIRLCACTEIGVLNSKKVKKLCLKDKSETVKNTCEKLEVFEK